VQAHSRMQVGDDDARHGSEAEPPVSLPVLCEVLPSVVQPNLMLLQESVQFIARFEAEQTTELGRCQFAFTVSLESDSFEGGAREVRSGGGQSSRKLIGQIESELHGGSIAEASPECTQMVLRSRKPAPPGAGRNTRGQAAVIDIGQLRAPSSHSGRRKRLPLRGRPDRFFRREGPLNREAVLKRWRYLATREVPDVASSSSSSVPCWPASSPSSISSTWLACVTSNRLMNLHGVEVSFHDNEATLSGRNRALEGAQPSPGS
jgi:hypothetical protein